MVGGHLINNKLRVTNIVMRIITGLLGDRLSELFMLVLNRGSCDQYVIYSPNNVELGPYRGPVHNSDIVELIHVGTDKLLNR